jgi:L-seryl-tRNA(Ser) seleniumtransferase
VGKLTLAALSATLDSYLRNSAEEEIPTVALLAATEEQLVNRAKAIQNEIGEQEKLTVVIETGMSPVGGGSLPGAELPTAVLALEHSHLSADEMTQKLRLAKIRIFGRIQNDKAILDLRSILPDDDSKVALAVRLLAAH